MARAQQRGVSALAVWMIVFVALWLTSTVLLVILYTGQEDLQRENQDLVAAKNRAISPTEERSIQLVREANERKTIVGLMNDERMKIASLATGDENDWSAGVETKLREKLDLITTESIVPSPRLFQNVSSLEALDRLYNQYQALHALYQDAEERAQDLDERVAKLIETNETQKSQFEEQIASLNKQMADVEADRARYRQERDAAVAKLEAEFDLRRNQVETELAEAKADRADAQDQLTQLRERFDAQQEKFGKLVMKPTGLPTARQPDGKILMAVPGDEVVYINLGAADRITLGMQFTVYSRESGIPADGKGKARIEVVSLSDSSAECKPVHIVGNEVILEGDLIANPIYDRDRQLRFVVIGQFDLDYDGRPDPDGAATIEALITSWGGTVMDDLSAMTDFVVVGSEPKRPGAIGGASTEEAKRIEATRRVYERYHDTVTKARSLSVPVLTQSIFMHFLGFAGDQPLR